MSTDPESTADQNPEQGPDPQPAQFEDLVADESPQGAKNPEINMILDVKVDITMEVGHAQISINDLLQLNAGSVVELDRLAGDPLDVKINGILIAHGEVVVVNERFGFRITDVVSPSERIKNLN